MKYYVGFPISLNCNLRCPYCFNQEFYRYVDGSGGEDKWHTKRSFSLQEYRNWRNHHLTDATEIVMHLFGGEPFCSHNIEDVFEIISFMDKERIDLLSNGICDISVIERLRQYVHKIHRIGFTFHRQVIGSNTELVQKFEKNVLHTKSLGLNLYVKELLFKEKRDEILENSRFWKKQGVNFKIQDFKGIDRGLSQEEYSKYTPMDHLLIDNEYKHGNPCSCLHGYKNVFIRGYDMKDVWPKGGDVIACWYDPTVVGNIHDDWFNSNYVISRKPNGQINVTGVEKLYRGTHERDLPIRKENV